MSAVRPQAMCSPDEELGLELGGYQHPPRHQNHIFAVK